MLHAESGRPGTLRDVRGAKRRACACSPKPWGLPPLPENKAFPRLCPGTRGSAASPTCDPLGCGVHWVKQGHLLIPGLFSCLPCHPSSTSVSTTCSSHAMQAFLASSHALQREGMSLRCMSRAPQAGPPPRAIRAARVQGAAGAGRSCLELSSAKMKPPPRFLGPATGVTERSRDSQQAGCREVLPGVLQGVSPCKHG